MPLTGPIPEGRTFFCPHCGALYSVTDTRRPKSDTENVLSVGKLWTRETQPSFQFTSLFIGLTMPNQSSAPVIRNSDSGRRHVRHTRDLDRESIGECHFPETVEASRCARVTGVEVGTKGDQILVHAQAPQPRDPFGRFPVEHARIGQACKCENRWIPLRAHVLI